jgi:cytochrome P450
MTIAEPLVFNPLDPAFRVDPYPVYRRLLAEAPVYQTPLGVPAFSRFADCLAILKNHKEFSSDDRKSPMYAVNQANIKETMGPDFDMFVDEGDRPFLFMDPPDHTRLRRLVNLAFTPRAVEALRPRIKEIVNDLLDAIAEKGGDSEVIADLAYPLPVAVICEMLGVPEEDRGEFREWSDELVKSLDPGITLTPEQMQVRFEAIKQSRIYFKDLIARRRKTPGDDLLTALISAEEEGDKLSEAELLSISRLVLVAGHETTVNLIANGVLQLLRHPAELARFQDDPGLAPSVVEEVLRFDPPVQFDGRFCVDGAQVNDHVLSPQTFVLLLLGAANRDPEQFEDPDRFDIARNDDRHLAFGYGIHFCLGAPLARLEGQVALQALADRFKSWKLLDPNPPYKDMITIRGPESLRVSFS